MAANPAVHAVTTAAFDDSNAVMCTSTRDGGSRGMRMVESRCLGMAFYQGIRCRYLGAQVLPTQRSGTTLGLSLSAMQVSSKGLLSMM